MHALLCALLGMIARDHTLQLLRGNAARNRELARRWGWLSPKRWFHLGQALAYRRCAQRLKNAEEL